MNWTRRRINDILKSFTVSTFRWFFLVLVSKSRLIFRKVYKLIYVPPKLCSCSLWVFLSQINAAFVMVHVLASKRGVFNKFSTERRVQRNMEKAVIYFNYFAFQTSSSILCDFSHPRIWHWLKKHLNEALVFENVRQVLEQIIVWFTNFSLKTIKVFSSLHRANNEQRTE